MGCAHLEEALSLLEEAGMTPGSSKLATEIQKGLQDLKPHCLLEHLKVAHPTSSACPITVPFACKNSMHVKISMQ